jgi:hypothetical protein
MPVPQDDNDFPEQRARLATILPRGRFQRAEDGTCVASSHTDPGAHLFEHTPGKLVGLFYVGGPARYLRALRGLVVRHLEGDGEGILHIAWTPELADRLPGFSRGRPRGAPFTLAVEAISRPRSDDRRAVGSWVPPTPLRASTTEELAR